MTLSNHRAYDEIPDLYDFEYPECDGAELAFWNLLSTQAKGPILELGVGTGRIALPLARLGHEVWGIDTSEPMLNRAKMKAARLPMPVSSRLHLSTQSMGSFDLPTQFGLIYAPFNSFLLLDPHLEVANCLDCVQRHLQPDGRLVIDAFVPGPSDFLPDEEELTYLEKHPQTGARVTRGRNYTYDSINRVAVSNITYTLETNNQNLTKYEFSYYLHLACQNDLVDYLRTGSFSILDIFGDYFGHQYRQSEDNLILVCKSSR